MGLCCTTQGGVARETVTGYAADLYAIDQTEVNWHKAASTKDVA
jgi:hypothetical protein